MLVSYCSRQVIKLLKATMNYFAMPSTGFIILGLYKPWTLDRNWVHKTHYHNVGHTKIAAWYI